MSASAEAKSRRERRSVVAELEGALLRDAATFPYFMLVAFEASGLPRFTALLALWPLLWALERALGRATWRCAPRRSWRRRACRARRWRPWRAPCCQVHGRRRRPGGVGGVRSCGGRRVVVTRMPRVMVERFAREHLGAHEVVGCDLEYSRLRRSTGFVRGGGGGERAVAERVRALFADGDRPDVGIARSESATRSFLPFCKVLPRTHRARTLPELVQTTN